MPPHAREGRARPAHDARARVVGRASDLAVGRSAAPGFGFRAFDTRFGAMRGDGAHFHRHGARDAALAPSVHNLWASRETACSQVAARVLDRDLLQLLHAGWI